MTASKTGALFGFVPKVFRPQGTDLAGGVLWGAAGLTAVIFLVQPFSWMKEQLTGPPPEEKQ